MMCNVYFICYLAGMLWSTYFHEVKISLLASVPHARTCSKKRQASEEIQACMFACIKVSLNQEAAEQFVQHCSLFRTVVLLMSLIPNNGNIFFLFNCIFN